MRPLGQTSSPQMLPLPLMENGSFSHQIGLQVCCRHHSVNLQYLPAQRVHEQQMKCSFLMSCIRSTPGEESGGYFTVGAEAFSTEACYKPGESAPLAWCCYSRSPTAEGVSLRLIFYIHSCVWWAQQGMLALCAKFTSPVCDQKVTSVHLNFSVSEALVAT